MKILALETSCDETATAIVEVTKDLQFNTLSNVVASQVDLHREFGGVVPEVAARSHLEIILPLIDKALRNARVDWPQLDGLAVTKGPGLLGALLIGVNTAKTLALTKNLPLIGVDHVHAHIYGAWLDRPLAEQPQFPVLALVVSGGHTQLVLLRDHLEYQLLGQTQDDAAGEAFDKVAKILGLGFPGGPALAAAAKTGDSHKYIFPKPQLDQPYNFSFSGVKTAVLRHLQQLVGKSYDFPSHQLAALLKPQQINDTAASFQAAAVNILIDKTSRAVEAHQPRSIVIAGGVAANQRLRQVFKRQYQNQVIYPPLKYCTDNAAMIGALGGLQLIKGKTDQPLELESLPSLSM